MFLLDTVSYYNYIALVFFALFALFIPASFLLTSKMLRVNKPGNKVKNAPYESAEEPIGKSKDVDDEYLAYFALFLPFEIIGLGVLLWSVVARQVTLLTNILVIGLVILSMGFAFIGYKITTEKTRKR